MSMTVKSVIKKLMGDQFEARGMDVVIVVTGKEYPILSIEPDKDRNIARVVVDEPYDFSAADQM